MLPRIRINVKSLYFRLILSFTMLSMLAIVFIALVFSNLYMESLYKQVSGEQIKSLEMVNKNIGNLFNEMDQIFINAQMNSDIDIFLSQRSSDDLVNNKARIQIRNLRQLNPYIYSVFLYNSGINEYLYEGDKGFDIENYLRQDASYKKSFVDSRNIYITKVNAEANPSFIKSKSGNYIITLEYGNHSISGQLQTLIVNLNNDLFIRGYLAKAGNTTFIFDKKGNIISHIDFEQIGKNIQSEQFYTQILASKSNSGNIIYGTGNNRSMVTYVKNESTGWYIVNFSPYEGMVKPIKDKRDALIFICSAVLLLCFIVIFLISSRLYHPIRDLTNIFRQSGFSTGVSESSEVTLITKVYREMQQHMQELEDKNKSNISLMKENFLQRILTVPEADKAFDDLKLHEYKLRIEFDNLLLCVFKIDGYMHMEDTNKILYESVVYQSIPEFLGLNFKYELVNMHKGEIVALLNFQDEKSNSFQLLVSNLERIGDSIAKTLGITISAGIGCAVNDVKDCPQSYKKALEMLQQRFVLGYGKIIYPMYVEEHLTRSISFPSEIVEKLISAVKLNHRAAFEENLGNMVYVLQNLVYTDAVQAFFQIMLACITEMDRVVNYENRKFSIRFEEMNHILIEMETLEQAKEWLLKIFLEYQNTMESIKHLKDNKFYRIIENTTLYIQQNYSDSSLSVEVLADMASYTPNYFSKIFREITGINAGEYIRQIRIMKARELLKLNEYKVNDVAEMCGFINSSHFYSAFKKDVGLTPAAYREFTISQKL